MKVLSFHHYIQKEKKSEETRLVFISIIQFGQGPLEKGRKNPYKRSFFNAVLDLGKRKKGAYQRSSRLTVFNVCVGGASTPVLGKCDSQWYREPF